MCKQVPMIPIARRMMERYLGEHIPSNSSQEERVAILASYGKDMHPDDMQYFAHIFLSKPTTQPQQVTPTHKPKRVSLEEYNKGALGGWDHASRMDSQTYHDKVVARGNNSRIRLKSMNKKWRKSTLARNEVLSQEMAYWPPVMGGRRALRVWSRRVVARWPVYGGETPYCENGMKVPPAGLQVTATFEVCKFHDESMNKPPSFFRVYAMYDRLTDSHSALWAEYTKQAISNLPATEIIVSEFFKDGAKQLHVQFTNAGNLKD